MQYLCKVKRLILIAVFFFLFKPLFPIVEYIANYDYISKVLCVNKNKPAMACNGKCHLMRELAKAAENEKPVSDKKAAVKNFETLFFQEIKETIYLEVPVFTNILDVSYSNLYYYLDTSSAFHPPAYIS
jgi:5-methylthioribose kinase